MYILLQTKQYSIICRVILDHAITTFGCCQCKYTNGRVAVCLSWVQSITHYRLYTLITGIYAIPCHIETWNNRSWLYMIECLQWCYMRILWSQLPATQMLVQHLVRAYKKGYIKALISGRLWEKSSGDRLIHSTPPHHQHISSNERRCWFHWNTATHYI